MQAFLPSYLEMSLESFAKQQERMRGQFAGLAPGKIPGMGVYEEQIRQNMALFDRAMKMFSPFAYVRPEDAGAAPAEAAPAPAAAPAGDDSLAELKRQMEAMQEQLAKLANKS